MTTELREGIRLQATNIYDLPLRPDLSNKELEEAMKLRDFARGPMIVYGPPGSGKTTFDIWFALKMYRYFYRPVIMDFWPTQEFIDRVDGNFTFVDENIIMEQLAEVDRLSKRDTTRAEDKSQWIVDGKCGTKFRGCTFIADEPDRLMDKRRNSADITLLVTDWFKRWRHLDISLVCSTPDPMDLDRRASNRFIFSTFCEPLMVPPAYEDYLLLCQQQGLEPNIDEFVLWVAEQMELFEAKEMPALWYRYTIKRIRRVTASTVVDEADCFQITVFAPNFWKYFITDNPPAGRASMIRKYEKRQRQQERGN